MHSPSGLPGGVSPNATSAAAAAANPVLVNPLNWTYAESPALPAWAFGAAAAYLAVVGAAGVASNAAVVVTYARHKEVRAVDGLAAVVNAVSYIHQRVIIMCGY